jgi:NodT family efflux transporter outer membrane factor (OMF) lipoprotein
MTTWIYRLAVVVLTAALGACAVGPAYRPPQADLPAAYAAAANPAAPQSAAPDLATWWRTLNDAELDSLVDRAVRSNLDIAIALDRLQRARTYEVVVVGHALPEIDASGAEARGTGADLSRSRAQQALVSADNSSGLQHINTLGGFDAVWQIDLFGKYRRELSAARAETQAARDARYGVLTAVIADVVRAYIDLRGLQVRAVILHRAADVLQESLRLVTLRYQRGITNELDVALATRELATFDAQIAPVEAQVSAAQYTLAVLIGEYPESMVRELAKPDLIPTLPTPIAAGAPLDLLKRRPDIRQAEHELAAATAQIGVATAALFPQVSLVGAIGAQGQNGGATPSVGGHIWSFGPGAEWPLLDFGALDAQVDIAGIAAREDLANYRKTVLTAVQQVDSALDGLRAQEARLGELDKAMTAAERAEQLATERYDRGLTDFLNVVDAERQLYDLQEQYAAAQVAAGEQSVLLYRYLGGGWENYQAVPAIRRPQPAVVAAFRRLIDHSIP